MFYSQLLLSKKGALGVVWMAAHCHKRIKRDQVQQTNITSSVDKILADEVHVVTHRILAFLLLGIVRIYSKKVEYLFHDCHEILNKLCNITTGKQKSKHAPSGVSLTHYYSISLPKRFELDEFDLDLLEDEDLVCKNVGSHEEIMLADDCQKDGATRGSLYKENLPVSEACSTAHTPLKDVFSPHRMGQYLFARTSFSLEDRLDPMVLDEAEEEQMHHRPSNEDPGTNFQEPANDIAPDSVVSPSNNRTHSLPSLEIIREETRFSSEAHLDPLVVGEAAKEQVKDRPSNDNRRTDSTIQEMELDCVTNTIPSLQGSDLGTIHRSDLIFEHSHSCDFKMLKESEKRKGHDEVHDKKHGVEEEHVERLGSQRSDHEDEPCELTRSVDKEQHVGPKKIKSLEVFTPESMKSGVFAASTPEVKLPGVGGTPEVTNVQTPAPRERARIQKKRPLFDVITVLPNKVLKHWIEETPSDLKRNRRSPPCTLLQAWRSRKFAYLPQSILEPLVPGISVFLDSLQHNTSRAPSVEKSVETSACQEGVRSPDRVNEKVPAAGSPDRVHEQIPAVEIPDGVHEQIPAVGSPDQVHEQIPAVGSPHEQTPIAPATPVTGLSSLRPHDAGAVADSDILESSSSSEGLGLETMFGEETNSFDGDSKEKELEGYSTRTRAMASYLRRKFLAKKRRNEEQVLNLSALLTRKTKKESARLFYEILILKTRDCICAQQDSAYSDILLRGTLKLQQAL